MTGLDFTLAAIMLAPVPSQPVQSMPKLQSPPPTILARAWRILSEHGPIGSDFTKVAISWLDGAYYMTVDSGHGKSWKMILVPPLQDRDWNVRLLVAKPLRDRPGQAAEREKNVRVEWSSCFAKAITQLAPLFANANAFQARVVPDEKPVVYFFEMNYPPAWITFTVAPAGDIKITGHGF
jgi:hypothetical protein